MRHFIVGLDGSAPSIEALRWAAALAKEAGIKLTIVHVRHVPTVWSENPSTLAAVEPYVEELEQQARGEAAEVLGEEGLPFEFVVRSGDPAAELDSAAVEAGADVIVVSGHGYRGFDRLLLGSVTTRLVHTARRPVLVVR
jgi:nucleotide-binding universal stress UspA family protein